MQTIAKYGALRRWTLLVLVLLAAGCGEDDVAEGAEQRVAEPVVDGDVRITVLTPTLLRLEYSEGGVFEDRPSQTVGRAPSPAAPLETSVEDGVLVVKTEALTLRYQRGSGPFADDNLTIELRRGDETIRVSPEWGKNGEDPDALGGWLRGLDLIGERVPLRPGLLSRRGWKLLDDTDTALLTDVAPGYVERPERAGPYQDGYFFGYGLDYRRALADLRYLTGPAPLLPRTAFGVWFSRYFAYSAEEWRALIEEFAARELPLDVISLDTDWKRPPAENVCESLNAVTGARPDDPCSWNGWDWNFDIFPDPPGFLAWVRDRGIDVGLNIHPSINAGEPEFAVVERAGADPALDVSSPPCEFLQADASNDCLVFDLLTPEQIEAYFALHDPIAEAGVDFWWFDWCCERTGRFVPGLTADTWINQLYYAEHRALGSRWPSFSRMGGAYGSPPDEASLLGAYAEHRQTLHFTGDTCSTWELIEFAVEMTVGQGAIGLPYVSHDIGSFHGEYAADAPCNLVGTNPRLSDDMYVRWMQLGTFQPLYRLHSNHGDRLPWDYPGEAEQIASDFLRLRGRLVPHLYTLSREAHDTGLPMTRALYLQWPEQPAAYDFPAQFTLGDDLLVATVAAPGESPTVDIWVPPGTWHNFFTGEQLTGPQVVSVEVPLAQYPVLARSGTILPLQPELPTSSRGPQDDLTLMVWAGGDGTYTLYEDEGTGFAYEQGAFRHTPIEVALSEACAQVTIGAAEGPAFPGALETRSWTVELVGVDAPGVVAVDGEVLGAGEWSYDADSRRVRVSTGAVDAGGGTVVLVGGCE